MNLITNHILHDNLAIARDLDIQGEYYVPVQPNRGCYEAVKEVILKISIFSSNFEAF